MYINFIKKIKNNQDNNHSYVEYSEAYYIVFHWVKNEIKNYYNQNGKYPKFEYIKKAFNKWKLDLKRNTRYNFVRLRHYVLIEAVKNSMDYFIENNPYNINIPLKRPYRQFYYPAEEIKFQENRVKLIKAADTILECRKEIYDKYLYNYKNGVAKKIQLIKSIKSDWYMNVTLTFHDLNIHKNIYIEIENDIKEFLNIKLVNIKKSTYKNYKIKINYLMRLFKDIYYRKNPNEFRNILENEFNLIINRVVSSIVRYRPKEIIFINNGIYNEEKKMFKKYQNEFFNTLKNTCKKNRLKLIVK